MCSQVSSAVKPSVRQDFSPFLCEWEIGIVANAPESDECKLKPVVAAKRSAPRRRVVERGGFPWSEEVWENHLLRQDQRGSFAAAANTSSYPLLFPAGVRRGGTRMECKQCQDSKWAGLSAPACILFYFFLFCTKLFSLSQRRRLPTTVPILT